VDVAHAAWPALAEALLRQRFHGQAHGASFVDAVSFEASLSRYSSPQRFPFLQREKETCRPLFCSKALETKKKK